MEVEFKQSTTSFFSWSVRLQVGEGPLVNRLLSAMGRIQYMRAYNCNPFTKYRGHPSNVTGGGIAGHFCRFF